MTHDPRDVRIADLERALRRLAADDRALQAPSGVHAAVMQSWDATMTTVVRRRPLRGPWHGALIAAAAAAIIVAAIVSSLILSRNRADPRPADSAPYVAREAPRSTPNTAPVLVEDRTTKPPTRLRRGSRAGRVARRPRGQDSIVLVADPVLDASALSVIRVRMPRSTLAHLGIPIADPEAGGSVDLEVLVGEDGIARTIRRAVPVTGSDPQE